MRPLDSARVTGDGPGHRNGGHRRRCRALLRSAVPVSLRAARSGQVRAHAAPEPGPAARHRSPGHRRAAAHRRRVGQPGPGARPGRARLTMLVTEAIGQALTELGVDTAFGLVGSGNFHVTNALIARGTRFIAARHENGAASMADGWARITGRPGVLSLHQGPGITNALTALTEAAKSRTPLLVLAADVSHTAKHSNFRIDVAAISAGIGATPARLHSAGFAVDDLVRAYRTAEQERRCVILAMPLDVQAGECTWPGVAGVAAGDGGGAAPGNGGG